MSTLQQKKAFLREHGALTVGIVKMHYNGYKVITIKRAGYRAFSIPTVELGSYCHGMLVGEKLMPHQNLAAWGEIVAYIADCGTERQKAFFASTDPAAECNKHLQSVNIINN